MLHGVVSDYAFFVAVASALCAGAGSLEDIRLAMRHSDSFMIEANRSPSEIYARYGFATKAWLELIYGCACWSEGKKTR
jgi:hypothetical protein